MLQNLDRSGYFGGSDSKYIMAKNRDTKSFKKWWNIKTGELENSGVGTVYTRAGNLYEHDILNAIDEEIRPDGQIIYDKYLLRINYDGWKDGTIFEVKTHRAKNEFKVSKEYWMQCQVEMFVYDKMHDKWFLPPLKELIIVNYPLRDDEYDVDKPVVYPERIQTQTVKYEKDWVKMEYLPRVKELAKCLKKGVFPT